MGRVLVPDEGESPCVPETLKEYTSKSLEGLVWVL
jgi:hypothetical protein